MFFLALNAGSSSLRFALFDQNFKRIYRGHVDAIQQKHGTYRSQMGEAAESSRNHYVKNHTEALKTGLRFLQEDLQWTSLEEIQLVAHRVVHGGEKYKKATRVNQRVLKDIEALSELAPLHNPANLQGLQAAQKLLPKISHYAIFDTAFHHTLPEKAFLYGLPYKLYQKQKIRRYGFHGTSHQYVAKKAAQFLKKRASKVVTCHMGNGISLAAIKNGKSLDTTMGLTPLEGPVMGTRSGSFDPAILFHLAKKTSDLKALQELVEKESGFKGLSGISSDMRLLRAKSDSPGSQRCFDVLSYQIAKYIGAMTVALEGLDAIVFTAGIGEHAYYLRERICAPLKHLGVLLNTKANIQCQEVISSAESKVKVFVIPTNEELEMVQQAVDDYNLNS